MLLSLLAQRIQTPFVQQQWPRIFIAGMVLLSALVLWSAREVAVSIEALHADQQNDLGWKASRVEVQVVQLQRLLAETKAGKAQPELLQRRWEELQSGLDLLYAAIPPAFAASQPDLAPTLDAVKAGVAETTAAFRTGNGAPPQSFDVLEAEVALMAPPAQRLATLVNQSWKASIERRSDNLVGRIEALALAVGGLLLLLGGNQLVVIAQRRSLNALTGNLVRAVSAAEEANAAKTSFLDRMSHELRTPLNAIIGFAEVMQAEIFGPIGHARYKGYSADILNSGRNLLGLVESVLDVSRIGDGSVSVAKQSVAVGELASGCIAAMQDRTRGGAVRIASAMQGDLPRLHVDPEHLRKILLQLLDNAVKFSPDGAQVEMGACRSGSGKLEIWVKDDGPGIPTADLEKVLLPFNQVRNHLVFHQDGLGLGLPIAKSLTELNGGAFELNSAPGRGTEARLRFDVAA